MGTFDTIMMNTPFSCQECGAQIFSVQTKAFACVMETYRVTDSISHEEDVRIMKEMLSCTICKKHLEQYVYIAVVRGILAGTEHTFEKAQALLEASTSKEQEQV